MGHITYNQGETLLLSSFFQNDPPTFGPFYVGLGTGGAFLSENGELGDLNEIQGQGYERFMIERSKQPAGWTLHGDYVQSPEVVFRNTHPLESWEPVDYAFITLSQSGTNEPAILIAASEFPHSLEVKPQDAFRFSFRFRQITTGVKHQRVNYAASSLLASVVMTGSAEVV